MAAEKDQEALRILLSPDGYYTYLKVKPFDSSVDAQATNKFGDTVKKSYRKLCLKHHPDKGGSAATFHALNRAFKVLKTPALRKQYDLLGLDLDDEDPNEDTEHDINSSKSKKDDGDGTSSSTEEDSGDTSGANTVMSQIATATLGGILKVCVQTMLMGATSLFISQYRILLYPALIFIAYSSYQFRKADPGQASKATIVLVMIGAGMLTMHFAGNDEWTMLFWFGESLVLGLYMFNIISPESTPVIVTIFIVAPIIAFFIGGRFWRYAMLVGCEASLGLVAIIVFPMMEMILEELINEKLKKVGEKIRAHARRMDQMKNK